MISADVKQQEMQELVAVFCIGLFHFLVGKIPGDLWVKQPFFFNLFVNWSLTYPSKFLLTTVVFACFTVVFVVLKPFSCKSPVF